MPDKCETAISGVRFGQRGITFGGVFKELTDRLDVLGCKVEIGVKGPPTADFRNGTLKSWAAEPQLFELLCGNTCRCCLTPMASWAVRLRALDTLCTPGLLWCCEAMTWDIDELRHLDYV